jgi:hypothetical protein
MDTNAVVDFEVYLLMTMKPRLSLADTRGLVDDRVSRVGLSLEDAVRIHERITAALTEETSRFREVKALLRIPDKDATTLSYSSVLWPGFDFNAHADERGSIESAGYTHAKRVQLDVESPPRLAAWSCDILEFEERFGPIVQREKRPLFDNILPAYEGYEFTWKGDRYGASFLWGLFLSSSAYWE